MSGGGGGRGRYVSRSVVYDFCVCLVGGGELSDCKLLNEKNGRVQKAV